MVSPPTDDASKDDLRELVMKALAEIGDLRTSVSERDRLIAAQAKRIEDLEAKLRKDSCNSSKPPSSDAPWSKKRRQRRPASGKKQGGQPGHEGTSRALFDASDVDDVVEHRPACCSSCGGSDLEAIERAPMRHQVTEIPRLAAEVVEHRLNRARCRSCGEETIAALPRDVPASAFGPRLQALTAHLTGVHRVSRREASRLLHDAFGVAMSVGSVSAIEARMSTALHAAHDEALRAVRSDPVVNVDETPWKWRGKLTWLWTATTERVTAFRVDERRSFEAFKRLLGESFAGLVVSDRMGAYDKLPTERRQLCWAHLDRDFRALKEGTEGERGFGRKALLVSRAIFRSWRSFTDHEDRARLAADLRPSWEKLIDLLVAHADSAERRVRAICRHLLDRAEALSTFADHPGVDPTNNAAERAVRKAVLWRKGSFGSQSEHGCRFVERMLAVAATLRQQQRNVFDYLVEVASAPLSGRPPPALLPATALPD